MNKANESLKPMAGVHALDSASQPPPPPDAEWPNGQESKAPTAARGSGIRGLALQDQGLELKLFGEECLLSSTVPALCCIYQNSVFRACVAFLSTILELDVMVHVPINLQSEDSDDLETPVLDPKKV